VIIRAQNPGNRLLPGMTANLQIVTGERRGVMVVSNEALRFQPRGSAVSLVKSTTPSAGGVAPASRPTQPAAAAPADAIASLQRDLSLDDATMARIRVALRDVANVRPQAGVAAAGRAGAQGAAGQGGAVRLGGGQPGGGGGGGGGIVIRPGPGGPGGAGPGGGPALGPGPGPGGGPPGGDLGAALAAVVPGAGGDEDAPVAARVAPNDLRDQIRARTDEVLRGILTPDQFAKYQALQLSRDGGTRIGSLWVHEDDGSLTQRQVTLGLASLNTTEVVSSDISEGARIVLRVREVAK
jgi:hypothetical protein